MKITKDILSIGIVVWIGDTVKFYSPFKGHLVLVITVSLSGTLMSLHFLDHNKKKKFQH
jgi:hypothetical protein